ncbi:MAG: aldehyde dehydrogenase family protein [Planctomycetota bacterium]
MKHFFPRLLRTLEVTRFFPNVVVSRKERGAFLRERSALRIDPKTDESLPVTDAVIFTGQPRHAERLRLLFDRRTLFIANGAGHNPIVVAADADVDKAVDATLKLQLYNQGQDCAAPNAILVHKRIFPMFLRALRQKTKEVCVGQYRDRSCTVGPISEPSDLVRIQGLLVEHRQWLDPSTPGIIRTRESIVEPTIITKPLKEGGNFTEVFAPLLFVQHYEDDAELALYFESPHYTRHAMYVTLYGTSPYVRRLIGRSLRGRVLHEPNSLLHNTHLHAPGMERGTQPYGGNGDGASNLSLDGQIHHKATLPQRDIHQWLVKPLVDGEKLRQRKTLMRRATRLVYRDIEKVLGQRQATAVSQSPPRRFYIDAHALTGDGPRYVAIEAEHAFSLLSSPNIQHIAAMRPDEINEIRGFAST